MSREDQPKAESFGWVEAEEEGLEADVSRPKIVGEAKTARTAFQSTFTSGEISLLHSPFVTPHSFVGLFLLNFACMPRCLSRMFFAESRLVSGGASDISLRLTIERRQH